MTLKADQKSGSAWVLIGLARWIRIHNTGLNNSICLITPDFSAISHTEKYSPSYGKNGLCLVQKLTYPFEHSTGYGKVQCGVVLHCTVWYRTIPV
jgi:hypothetical protein